MENRIGDARRQYAQFHGGFTQQQAADYFGVSLSTYKKWEQGKGKLNGSALQDISSKYGVTVDYLLMLDNDKHPAMILADEETELMSILRNVSPEGRRQLMVFARGIAATYPKE